MQNELSDQLKNALSAHHDGGSGVLVAVSGGKDSMTLMALLKGLQSELSHSIIVAHYDHGWRAESEQDAIFVMEEAARMGFSCILGRPERPPTDSEKTESIAREQRYQFLTRTAQEHNCGTVLTAHTADDQVETVLHNILRGTGLAGLSGMSRMRFLDDEIRLVRPLIDASRSEIDRYAEQAAIPFREDSTNSALKYTRNLIRHEVLNCLESKGFESTRDSILRLSRQADDAQQTIIWIAKEVVERALLCSSPDRIELSCEVLESFPRHLVREVFVEIWRRQEWARQEMGYADWDRLAELVSTPGRFQVSGPVDCRQKRGKIFLERHSG